MTEVKVIRYVAEDGTVFENATECKNYEKTLGTEYELTFKVNAILRLDGIVLKRRMKTNAKPNFDYGSEFIDTALDTIYDTDNYETAGELLAIAARQNIYPYLECFEKEIFDEYKKIE